MIQENLSKIQAEFLTHINRLNMGYELTLSVQERNSLIISFWYLGTDYKKDGINIQLYFEKSVEKAYFELYTWCIDELKKINLI